MEIISWIIEHKEDIVALYLAIVGAASIIVKLTPTLKDDTFLKEVIRFIGRYIALNR